MAFHSEQADRPTLTVGICIGTYNQGQYLRGAIESALAQTYPIQEIWIADDGSSDDTQAIAEEYSRKHLQCPLPSPSGERGTGAQSELGAGQAWRPTWWCGSIPTIGWSRHMSRCWPG